MGYDSLTGWNAASLINGSEIFWQVGRLSLTGWNAASLINTMVTNIDSAVESYRLERRVIN